MMEVPVRIPKLLQTCTDGLATVVIKADTVASAVDALIEQFPLLRESLLEINGQFQRNVEIYYNDDDARLFENLEIPLKAGDEIGISLSTRGR